MNAEIHQYAGVVLNIPLDTVFTYKIPSAFAQGRIRSGCRVLVPFRSKRIEGYVVETYPSAPEGIKRIREILALVDSEPLLSSNLMSLAKWMSGFYCASLGEVLEAIGPSKKRRIVDTFDVSLQLSSQEAIDLAQRISKRSSRQALVLKYLSEKQTCSHLEISKECGAGLSVLRTMAAKGFIALHSTLSEYLSLSPAHRSNQAPPEMNKAQQAAVDKVVENFFSGKFRTFLLHGVTGSGKTEVYLRIISQVVAHGGQAIVLVPEISLTPQTIGRFRERFPRLAIMHSRMSAGIRRQQWELARSGKADVVIGARSAVFAPLPNLKMIVVDEEHEPSYKQENTPRYHAREVAIMRAMGEKAGVVLGSATPSLESYRNSQIGKFEYLHLPDRVPGATLPEVRIVDMKEERSIVKKNILFSRELIEQIGKSLERKEQVLLFLNRRGFHVFGRCSNCFSVLTCPHCDVTLTYHKSRNTVSCHFCGWSSEVFFECPECKLSSLVYVGSGTERVEDVLERLFPNARLARMDADTTSRQDSHSKILGAFRNGEYDILLGTQMIAKGLDYPRISTVGVIDADVSLAFPDFRAQERTFQLLSQVAGRTGRGKIAGTVIIQTSRPRVAAIQFAAMHDYISFAKQEMEERRALNYPPFGKMCRIIAKSKNPQAAYKYLAQIKESVAEIAQSYHVRILGPTQAPIAKTEDKYRYHMLLRASSYKAIQAISSFVRKNCPPQGEVASVIDVNPYSML